MEEHQGLWWMSERLQRIVGPDGCIFISCVSGWQLTTLCNGVSTGDRPPTRLLEHADVGIIGVITMSTSASGRLGLMCGVKVWCVLGIS